LLKKQTSPIGQSQPTKYQSLTETTKSASALEKQNLVSGLFFESEIDTSELSPDLIEIVSVWPDLPGYIRAAIKALIETHIRGKK